MSTNEWTELTRLWQSDVPAAAPALEVIAKQQRRAWVWRLTWIAEVVVTILGVAISLLAMASSKPYGLIIGAGTLALTLFAAGASLWARSLRRAAAATADVSVLASLDAALHRARVSVRWGLASFWIMVVFLLYVAMMSFIWASGVGANPPGVERRLLIVVGVWAVWGAICQAFAVVYYQRRIHELARLEELKRALDESAP
jgi:hypothetical protein